MEAIGYLENLVSCRVYRFWIPTFLLRKRYPIIEVTFTSHELENVNSTLFPAEERYVYPLGFTEETRNLWRDFLTEKEILRLRDRWRWEMLIYWLSFYFGIVLIGWFTPHSHVVMEKFGITTAFT